MINIFSASMFKKRLMHIFHSRMKHMHDNTLQKYKLNFNLLNFTIINYEGTSDLSSDSNCLITQLYPVFTFLEQNHKNKN